MATKRLTWAGMMAKQKQKDAQRDLSRLKRSELLEIMYAQSEEIDRLRAELARKDRELADRRIAIESSGSIAEASLRLTRVFEEAQKAADLYVDNVRARATAQGSVRSAVSQPSAALATRTPAAPPAPPRHVAPRQ